MIRDLIAVLDFGGQYSHLITRRVRECEVYAELLPYTTSAAELSKRGVKGIVLSGGPASVYDKDAPSCDPEIFKLGIPILGICYGLQLMVQISGGHVKAASRREYGRSRLDILDTTDLLKGLSGPITVWMSHGDYAETLPEGFDVIGSSDACATAAIRNKRLNMYGVQFHPEVAHTEHGTQMIWNFIRGVCGCAASWNPTSIIESATEEVRSRVGNEQVLTALSGGVDSTTVAVLLQRALGDRALGVFVNHGLLRKNEGERVLEALRSLKINLRYVDASSRFLERLRGVNDPEEKRRIIGGEFIKIFQEEAGGAYPWLAQGTLYPDVIESAASGSPASRIKSHHNVAGLPELMKFKIIEPLRMLYKDEVRKIAKELQIPDTILRGHPFPGPGLAVRIIGEVTPEKLRICRDSSAIVEEVLIKHGLHEGVWQAFTVVGDDLAVGVQGDQRTLGHIVTIRMVESTDGMTADWARIPQDILEEMSNRITSEVPGVTLVSYAITSKPPSTIEPC